jgi:hypothetical protein
MVEIFLGPPRQAGSTDRKARNWTLVVGRPWGAHHISLYGTHANDPQGAQAAANKELGEEYNWVPRGTGFQAQEER